MKHSSTASSNEVISSPYTLVSVREMMADWKGISVLRGGTTDVISSFSSLVVLTGGITTEK